MASSPTGTRRGRQRKYSNHAIEPTVTLGLVFGLASRQTEGVLRSLLTRLTLDNDVPDHSTISRRQARLGKVASSERRTVKPVHLRIDRSGLAVHVGHVRTPPNARASRKRHLAVDEHPSDGVACELTSTRARDASRVASLVGQIERPIASATAAAAYATGDVSQTLGVVARIVTSPHDATRQDPHLSRRYDTGRPRAVIRLRIAQPRTTSLPYPAGLRARRPAPIMDVSRKHVCSPRP